MFDPVAIDCGTDFIAVKDKIKGDFVIIPESVIKSDEPILIDGMKFDELKAKFDVPVHSTDLIGFIGLFSHGTHATRAHRT